MPQCPVPINRSVTGSGNRRRLALLSGPRTACVVHEPVVAGIAAGIVGVLLTSRLVQALPFGVRPTDSVTVTAVVIAIGVVATAACAWPILRAVEAARESACKGARGAKPSD